MAMKKTIIFSLLFLTTFGLSVQEAPPKQLKDFGVFKSILFKKEGHLDLHVNQRNIKTAFDFAERSLNSSRSLLDQYKVYALTLSVIQCGHTQIYPTKEVYREWLATRNSLPIDLILVGRHLITNELEVNDLVQYKTEHDMNKPFVPTGAEILMIDGKTVEEMMDEMGLFISSDEGDDAFKYFQAQYLFDFYHHLALPYQSSNIPVTYSYKGDTVKLELPTGTAPVFTMNRRLALSSLAAANEDKNMGEFEITQGVGYFRFKSFKSSYGKEFTAFLENSFRKLKDRKVDRLIVDLRGNTGGVMQYEFMKYIVGPEVYLGKYIIEKPKSGIENKHIKKFSADYIKHKRSSRIQKKLIRRNEFDDGKVFTEELSSSLIYEGDIVVITDEGTFSSAAILACHLKTLAHAKIAGRPAGGSFYKGNAGTLTVVLPYSKLHFYVNPNTYFSHLEDGTIINNLKDPDIFLDAVLLDEDKRDNFYFLGAKKGFE